MLQQIMTAPGVIEFKEVPIPEVGEAQALIKIEKIGICGSDIHVFHGKHPFTKYPVTQGHEVSGTVERLGLKAYGLYIGQKVTIEPQIICGECYPCLHGKYNLCDKLKVMGFQATGMAAHYFAADVSRITPLPDDFSLNDGALIEPLAVAVHAVEQAGDVCNKDIIVIGAGPIGNLVAQTAISMGARKVMITDISNYRLNIAKKCNIDVCVNTHEKDLGEAIYETFGPDKADVIYDCAGTNTTMGQAIAHARKGSMIVLVAVFSDLATVDLATANDHELNINSTMMYRHEHFLKAIQLVHESKVLLQPMVSRQFAFGDYLSAYRFIDNNRETAMKVIINMQA